MFRNILFGIKNVKYLLYEYGWRSFWTVSIYVSFTNTYGFSLLIKKMWCKKCSYFLCLSRVKLLYHKQNMFNYAVPRRMCTALSTHLMSALCLKHSYSPKVGRIASFSSCTWTLLTLHIFIFITLLQQLTIGYCKMVNFHPFNL